MRPALFCFAVLLIQVVACGGTTDSSPGMTSAGGTAGAGTAGSTQAGAGGTNAGASAGSGGTGNGGAGTGGSAGFSGSMTAGQAGTGGTPQVCADQPCGKACGPTKVCNAVGVCIENAPGFSCPSMCAAAADGAACASCCYGMTNTSLSLVDFNCACQANAPCEVPCGASKACGPNTPDSVACIACMKPLLAPGGGCTTDPTFAQQCLAQTDCKALANCIAACP